MLKKIELAIPLFALAIEKARRYWTSRVDKVIKDKFTAVQPAVEWKLLKRL
jgi:hypothetical protein